jgi:hypothetical protein
VSQNQQFPDNAADETFPISSPTLSNSFYFMTYQNLEVI